MSVLLIKSWFSGKNSKPDFMINQIYLKPGCDVESKIFAAIPKESIKVNAKLIYDVGIVYL